MIIIFAGALGRFPVGGHAWAELNFILGLQALGHTVYFLEDCGKESWVYDWKSEKLTNSVDYPVQYISETLKPFSLDNQWIYRSGEKSVGMDLLEFQNICSKADLFIVRSLAIPVWREEYDWPNRRIFIDTDPGFIQIRIINGDDELADTLAKCERLFTIGQRLGKSNCLQPTLDYQWLKTVFPIFLPSWNNAEPGANDNFTSIMQWHSYSEVEYLGRRFGNKELSFPPYFDLPEKTNQPIKLAFNGDQAIERKLKDHGWNIVSGWSTTYSPEQYQRFIQNSKAEFSIAKHGYVSMKSGWFSDRSTCYLASGRPVLIQNTGQADWLPEGDGVLMFDTPEEAIENIDLINENYEHHCRSARQIAENCFDSKRVLTKLLDDALS